MTVRITAAAIGFLLLSQWVLSTLDASGKWLAGAGVSVLFISLVRYGVHLLLALGITGARYGWTLWRTRQPWLQTLRGVLMLASTVLFFSLLKRAPLAEATTMNFLAPIMTMTLAPMLLKERVPLSRWLWVALAFAGMLLVARPSGALAPDAVWLGLATAACFAGFQMVTRMVRADPPMTTLLYSGLIGTAGCVLALPFVSVTMPSNHHDWALLLTTGFTGMLGHLFLIAAYRRADASVLSPFIYLQVLSATTLGWAVFDQHPNSLTIIGMLLIVMAGAASAISEMRRHRTSVPLTPMP
jgi:drug/metabolite transporter (DMT)-like permease